MVSSILLLATMLVAIGLGMMYLYRLQSKEYISMFNLIYYRGYDDLNCPIPSIETSVLHTAIRIVYADILPKDISTEMFNKRLHMANFLTGVRYEDERHYEESMVRSCLSLLEDGATQSRCFTCLKDGHQLHVIESIRRTVKYIRRQRKLDITLAVWNSPTR